MWQESDSRVASTISTKPHAVEIEEERVLLPDTVYLTRQRARAMRLINPVEDSFYLVISAAALGVLIITFLGL
ncbi:MAG: hypothetical protein JO251_10155 [Verrucomicrobia bacterium]|nr:hypothetical protein [Verrucomicrobiota bacterium]